MSSNLAVINFTVGGSLTVSGKTTLAEPVLSSSTASFQGLTTTNLTTTGTSTFTSLPTSIQTPTQDSQLTTKIYVDTVDNTLNERITDKDTDVRLYIDASYNELNTRVSGNDTSVRTYIDASYNELNNRVSGNDTSVRTYIDLSYNTLNTRITKTDSDQKTYIDNQIVALGTKPLFYAYQTPSNTQTIPNNVMTQVNCGEIRHNVLTKYSNGDYSFSPFGYSGYYQINGTVCLPNINSGYIAIFKRGGGEGFLEISRGTSFSSSTTSPNTTLTVSSIIYLNGIGTTEKETLELRVICSPSTVIAGSISKCFFSGHFIQA